MKNAAHIFGIEQSRDISELALTFPETLRRTAAQQPTRGVTLLDRSGHSDFRSFPDLLKSIERAVGRWRSLGVKPGDRILLCLPTSWGFIDAWLGLICLGAHPAAIANAAGGLGSSSNFAERLEKYRSVIEAKRIVIGDRMAEDLREKYPDGIGSLVLTAAEIEACDSIDRSFSTPQTEDLAFLQFTSGSTGMPRAVQITHGMAIHNAFAIDTGIGSRHGKLASEIADSMTAWLPMHHDMGLIGCLTYPIAVGIDAYLMNPTTFLARPIRYLEALSGKRTIMSGPNFGYQFCVDRLSKDKLEGLDLSRIVAATSGSEMIRPETMDSFCELVSDTGFKREMMMPCYGMAEATLAVTFENGNRGIRTMPVPTQVGFVLENQEVVNVGVCIPDTEVKIVNPSEETVDEGELGHIYIKGPAVFEGYFENETESAASISGDWLRTGDLGFVDQGELYIAGRSKEILVIRGENIMPHEIEWLAEEARGQGTGGERTAAFSISRNASGEEIVLVVETNEKEPSKLAELDRAIKVRIGRALSLPVSDLVFVKRGTIPRTTSGKIQRSKVKQHYIEGLLDRMEWLAEEA